MTTISSLWVVRVILISLLFFFFMFVDLQHQHFIRVAVGPEDKSTVQRNLSDIVATLDARAPGLFLEHFHQSIKRGLDITEVPEPFVAFQVHTGTEKA